MYKCNNNTEIKATESYSCGEDTKGIVVHNLLSRGLVLGLCVCETQSGWLPGLGELAL